MIDYDRLHKLWDKTHAVGSPIKFVRDKVVFKELDSLVPGIALDAGCGTGEYSIFLAERGHKVTAFDPSPLAIEALLEKNGSNLEINAQLNTIDEFCSSLKFDSIVSVEVIEHIAHDYVALQKLYTLLKKGGVMVVSVPGTRFLYGETDKISGHFRRYSKVTFKKLLTMMGFTDIKVRSYGFPVLFVYLIFRKILFEKMLIKHFSTNSCDRKSGSNILKKIYPYILALDHFSLTSLGVGYVATCKK